MAKPLRKFLVSTVLLIAAFLACGSTAMWLIRTKPIAARSAMRHKPPVVRVQELEARDMREVFVGYGTARPDRDATLAAEVSGEIIEIPDAIKDGAQVAQGDLLLRIDDRPYVQQLARSESLVAELLAQLDQLEVERHNVESLIAIASRETEVNKEEYRRLSDLFERQEASKTEFNFARRTYDRSLQELQVLTNRLELIDPRRGALRASLGARQAEVELAQLELDRCRIEAPFTGQIKTILVEQGNHVMPGAPVAQLIDPNLIEIPVELPVSVHPRMELGAECTLSVDSMPEMRWAGAVARIAPVADGRSRTFSAYLEVDNREQDVPLLPGYFLTARVDGPMLKSVLAVPRGAIVDSSLFVANGLQAHLRSVHVDHVVGELALVSGDLAPGDAVILSNLDVLYDGAAVRLASDAIAPEPVHALAGHTAGDREASVP